MSTLSLKISKDLRKQFDRLGRAGLSQRANDLILEFAKKYPTGHYQEAIKLAGRMRAISLAARADTYWGEKTDLGFTDEALHDLPEFQLRQDGQE